MHDPWSAGNADRKARRAHRPLYDDYDDWDDRLIKQHESPYKRRQGHAAGKCWVKTEAVGEENKDGWAAANVDDIRNRETALAALKPPEMNKLAAESLAAGAGLVSQAVQGAAAAVVGQGPKWGTAYLLKKRDEQVRTLADQKQAPGSKEWDKKVLEAVHRAAEQLKTDDSLQLRGLMQQVAADDPQISPTLKKWPLMAAYEAEFKANPPLKDTGAVDAHKAFVKKARELHAV